MTFHTSLKAIFCPPPLLTLLSTVACGELSLPYDLVVTAVVATWLLGTQELDESCGGSSYGCPEVLLSSKCAVLLPLGIDLSCITEKVDAQHVWWEKSRQDWLEDATNDVFRGLFLWGELHILAQQVIILLVVL